MDFEALFLFLACSLVCSIICWLVQIALVRYYKRPPEDQWIEAFSAASLTFLWYAISIAFTIYNKWFLNVFLGGVDFPLVITAIHMVFKFVFSRVWYYGFHDRKSHPLTVPLNSPKFTTVVIIGVCTGADVALSNESIAYITLTMYTTIKSTVLVFTFFCAVYFRLESFRWPVFLSVVLVCVGVGMAVLSTVEFSLIGSLLCLAASLTAGLRWSLMQLLMKEEQQEDSRSRNSTSHIFATLYLFSPYAALAMVPVGAALEGGQFITYIKALSSHDQLMVAGTIAGGGFVALLLITVEMAIIGLTSSLTMSVLGQVKEVTLIVLSVLIFGDKVTLRTAVGILVSLLGAYYYKHLRSGAGSELRSSREVAMTGLSYSQLSEEANGLKDDNSDSDEEMRAGQHRTVQLGCGTDVEGSLSPMCVGSSN